jgi:hypothetical protein
MPCDEPWPPDRLSLFKLWVDEGFAINGPISLCQRANPALPIPNSQICRSVSSLPPGTQRTSSVGCCRHEDLQSRAVLQVQNLALHHLAVLHWAVNNLTDVRRSTLVSLVIRGLGEIGQASLVLVNRSVAFEDQHGQQIKKRYGPKQPSRWWSTANLSAGRCGTH